MSKDKPGKELTGEGTPDATERAVQITLGYYPEDLFPPVSKEELDVLNRFMPNLVTRLHCDGIRHGLGLFQSVLRESDE